MNFKAPRELWNPLRNAVTVKFHWSGGHRKRNCSGLSQFSQDSDTRKLLYFLQCEVYKRMHYGGVLCFVVIKWPLLPFSYHHDDVIKWKHFPALNERNPPVTDGFPLRRPVTRMCSLICAWTDGWANNRDADDLRRYHAHYDVSVCVTVTQSPG